MGNISRHQTNPQLVIELIDISGYTGNAPTIGDRAIKLMNGEIYFDGKRVSLLSGNTLFLALSGGTLTGALTGTSASFDRLTIRNIEISTSGATTGQVLGYSGGKFSPITVTLTGTTIQTGTTLNSTLVWNGLAWVENTNILTPNNNLLVNGIITGHTLFLNGIGIIPTGATYNQVLRFDGINFVAGGESIGMGTISGSTLRWNGSDYVEDTNVLINGGNLHVLNTLTANTASINRLSGQSLLIKGIEIITTGATVGQALIYSGGTFTPVSITITGYTLDSGTINNSTIKWNGSAWIENTNILGFNNSLFVAGRLTGHSLSLSNVDVNVTGATAGQVLFFTGNSFNPITLTSNYITEYNNLFFTEPRVLSTKLTGYTDGGGNLSSSDTILIAFGKAMPRPQATHSIVNDSGQYRFTTTNGSYSLREWTLTNSGGTGYAQKQVTANSPFASNSIYEIANNYNESHFAIQQYHKSNTNMELWVQANTGNTQFYVQSFEIITGVTKSSGLMRMIVNPTTTTNPLVKYELRMLLFDNTYYVTGSPTNFGFSNQIQIGPPSTSELSGQTGMLALSGINAVWYNGSNWQILNRTGTTVLNGTTNYSTLNWDGSNWVENFNILHSGGTISASTVDVTNGVLNRGIEQFVPLYVTAATTIPNTVSYVIFSSSTGGYNVNLPTTPIEGQTIVLKDNGNAALARPINISGGTKLVEGTSGLTLNIAYQLSKLIFFQNQWLFTY